MRGVVVLDNSSKHLYLSLRDRSIFTILIENKSLLKKTKETLLYGRILITKNPKNFIRDRIKFDYGIIQISSETSAKIISDFIIKNNLWNLHSFFKKI